MNILKISKSYIKNKNGMSRFHSWLAVIGICLGVTGFLVVSSVMGGIFHKIYTEVNVNNNYDLYIKGYETDKSYKFDELIGKKNIKKKLEFKALPKGYNSSVENLLVNIYITKDPYFKPDQIYITNKVKLNKKALFLQILKDNKVNNQDLIPITKLTDEELIKYPIGMTNIIISEATFLESFEDGFKKGDKFQNTVIYQLNNFMDTFDKHEKINEVYNTDDKYVMRAWFSNNKMLLENLTIEYTVIKIVLFFLILISSFSVMSTITLIISEKKQDIYLLKTIGYSDSSIASIFLISGLILGILGICLGFIFGTFISLYMKDILNILESILQVRLLPSSLKDFPIILEYSDYWQIFLFTIVFIFISSLIPALKAVKTSPAEGLKSE